MARSLDIAIIGCGTAGPAAALFLTRAGHSVTIFERFEAPKPVGAGFLVQPTGMTVLNRLGLLDQALAAGGRIARLIGHARSGRVVMDLPYGVLGPEVFGLGLHRGALFLLLTGALEAAGIPLRCGREIVAIEDAATDRPRLRDAHGETHGPFDLVIVADGAQSRLRAAPLVRRNRPYSWGALWAICADPDDRFAGALHQVYDGAQKMAGVLPVGRLRGGDDGPPLVSFFWSLHASRFDDWRAAGLAAWKDEVRAYWPATATLLDSIAHADDLSRAAYRDAVLSPWHAGRVVFIGDAGHSMSPQLGQGANIALIDALVLAQEIGAADGGGVEIALARFSRRRRAHILYYQRMSRWLTPAFQSWSRPVGWLRDLAMGPLCRFPPTRHLMITTMAGRRAGLLRGFEP